MPLLLRNVRENRWHKAEAKPWLDRDDVPADPLGDLKTTKHSLSVWEVASDRSNLERIVRNVTLLGNSSLADTGWVLFDSALLEPIDIGCENVAGTSPDSEANAWHRNLVGLSGKRLVALTKAILEHGESGTVLKKRLEQLVVEGIDSKQIAERFRAKIA
jgi:hypothetical protein